MSLLNSIFPLFHRPLMQACRGVEDRRSDCFEGSHGPVLIGRTRSLWHFCLSVARNNRKRICISSPFESGWFLPVERANSFLGLERMHKMTTEDARMDVEDQAFQGRLRLGAYVRTCMGICIVESYRESDNRYCLILPWRAQGSESIRGYFRAEQIIPVQPKVQGDGSVHFIPKVESSDTTNEQRRRREKAIDFNVAAGHERSSMEITSASRDRINGFSCFHPRFFSSEKCSHIENRMGEWEQLSGQARSFISMVQSKAQMENCQNPHHRFTFNAPPLQDSRTTRKRKATSVHS